MALFPMTFPFFFNPSDAYSPFRPLTEEILRGFGLAVEDSRLFLDPFLVHRLPDTVSIRAFDTPSSDRVFGLGSSTDREFDDVDSTYRVFGVDSFPSRSFDDDTRSGRF